MSLERHDEEAAEFSASSSKLDSILHRLQVTLRDDGPDVDQAMIMSYAMNSLPIDQRDVVRGIIFGQRAWFEAWLEIEQVKGEIRRSETLTLDPGISQQTPKVQRDMKAESPNE